MRIGVVGSRRRTDENAIVNAIGRALVAPDHPLLLGRNWRDMTIVSGGCRGVDTWAEEVARKLGCMIEVFRPEHPPGSDRRTMLAAMAVRNRKIAEACDLLIAFPAPDRKGGTEQTIKHAQRLGKPVILL